MLVGDLLELLLVQLLVDLLAVLLPHARDFHDPQRSGVDVRLLQALVVLRQTHLLLQQIFLDFPAFALEVQLLVFLARPQQCFPVVGGELLDSLEVLGKEWVLHSRGFDVAVGGISGVLDLLELVQVRRVLLLLLQLHQLLLVVPHDH